MSDQKPERLIPAAFRLKPETRRLLRLLSERKGVTMTAVLEILVREEAKREGLEIRPPATDQ